VSIFLAQHQRRADAELTATAVLASLESHVTARASFVVLPENCLAGGDGSPPTPALAEHVLERLASLARRHGAYVMTGSWPENGPDGRTQVARLLDPAGSVIAELRRGIEPDGSTSTGHDFPVVDTAFGRVGLLLGPDFWLVEPPRIQCIRGAELLLVAGSLAGRSSVAQRAAVWGIATLNTVAVAFASSLSASSGGGSAVAMPERFLFEAGTDEGVFQADWDLERIRHLREPDLRFQETLWFGLWARRPELYAAITHRGSGLAELTAAEGRT
jgi:predicted amidohydrolase